MRTFFAAKIRVQLFSKPQHTVANITNIAPQENEQAKNQIIGAICIIAAIAIVFAIIIAAIAQY